MKYKIGDMIIYKYKVSTSNPTRQFPPPEPEIYVSYGLISSVNRIATINGIEEFYILGNNDINPKVKEQDIISKVLTETL